MITATLNFDGGSRGNPGPAAAAAVLNIGGLEVRIGEYMDHATNNEAEYRALYIGVCEARKRGVNSLRIFGDSKLVINQVNGYWKCKVPRLDEYRQKILSILEAFPSERLTHVRRNHNSAADALANRVMDAKKDINEEGDPLPPPKPKVSSSSFEAIVKNADRVSFREIAALKVPGKRDAWTAKRLPALIEEAGEDAVAQIKSRWQEVDDSEIDDKILAKCLRWLLRGLTPALAVRKVRTDEEVSRNAAQGRRRRGR